MDVTEKLAAAASGPAVSVHIGISSGVAAVGSTRFEGLRGTRWVYSAEGFVINLGSRLADLAEAGQILVCPETSRRLQKTYRLQSLGPQQLQGIAAAMEVHRLERQPRIEE
jgi:class 3 adenylate cyclase